MGTLAISTAIDRIERLLSDASNVRWPEATLLKYLSDAQRLIVTVKPDTNPSHDTFELVAGTKQSIPDGRFRILRVARNMGTDGATAGRHIGMTDFDALNAADPDWHSATAAEVVQNAALDPDDPKTFWVYPPQPTAGQGRLLLAVGRSTHSTGAVILGTAVIDGDAVTNDVSEVSAVAGTWYDVAIKCLAWHPDGLLLAVGCESGAFGNPASTDFVRVYERDADDNSLTLLATLTDATLTGTIQDIRWSADGAWLAAAQDVIGAGGEVVVWKHVAGAFTKTTEVIRANDGEGESIDWSPDSRYLAIAEDGSATQPYIHVMRRVGSDPATVVFSTDLVPPSSDASNFNCVRFSPDGDYLAGTIESTPYLQVWQMVGETLTLCTLDTVPDGNAERIAWHPDGDWLAIALSVTPYLNIYKRTAATTFVKQDSPTDVPPGSPGDILFTPAGDRLLVGFLSTPMLSYEFDTTDGIGEWVEITGDDVPTSRRMAYCAIEDITANGYVQVITSKIPVEMTATTDLLEIDDIWLPTLVDYAVYRALSENTEAADYARAQGYLDSVARVLGLESERLMALMQKNKAVQGG